jgi:hypothetical protein
MNKRHLLKLAFVFQTCLLFVSRFISLVIYVGAPTSKSWVVGPTETAKTVTDISNALPNSVSVNLRRHKFYDQTYTYSVKSKFASLLFGPILLGILSCKCSGFLYVGPDGFLLSDYDFRELEFRWLKKRGKKIVSYQVGSEIRSLDLLEKWGHENNVETYATVFKANYSSIVLAEIESKVLSRAMVIDKYADLIFNSSIDQMSHLKSEVVPNLYLVDDNYFDEDSKKFSDLSNIVICHAPSNPLIKGTKEIREAVKTLEAEGHRIEYHELENVPHDQVLKQLSNSHIAINELYSMMPGVFAIEALTKRCVLLTSANWNYEVSLGSKNLNPWIISNRSSIYQNLKWCLENKELLENQASEGQSWAREFASRSKNALRLNSLLEALSDK